MPPIISNTIPGIKVITAKIATNIALPPNDGSGGIPASIYDDLASTELATSEAVGCVGI
ncbi:MAG: hypothetical protein ISR22_07275 [Candidatus Poseidoniaceae archaeon]|nr:hypothetical protein [Candidatus Poseidoniaceae archaeon]